MKFKIWNKQLKRFVSEDEWFINGKGEVFFLDIMDRELVKADPDIVVIQICTDVCNTCNKHVVDKSEKFIDN